MYSIGRMDGEVVHFERGVIVQRERRKSSSARDQSVDLKGTAEGLTYSRQTGQTPAPHLCVPDFPPLLPQGQFLFLPSSLPTV